jgi:hypothetical protein
MSMVRDSVAVCWPAVVARTFHLFVKVLRALLPAVAEWFDKTVSKDGLDPHRRK